MAKPNNLFEEALAAEGISGQLADVARSIYKQESGGGKNTKTSNAGAVGGMQIIPSTFASVADKGWDINDPLLNARAGIRYLKQLDKQAGGNPVLTAAGYYGGPGGLEKARRGIAVSDPRNPNAPNTLQYGEQVAARLPGAKGGSAPSSPASPVVVAEAPASRPEIKPVAQGQVVGEALPPVQVAETQAQAVPSTLASESKPDAWQEFISKFKKEGPVQAADLQYGARPTAPLINVQVPDFMAAVAPTGGRRVDLSSFMGWGARQA